MTKKTSKADLEAELRVLKRGRSTDGIVLVCLNLIRWGALWGISYNAYLSIESLSGKYTLADIGVNFLSQMDVSITLAWGAGLMAVVYGLKQRKLRKDTIERMQLRVHQLETKIDPNRSSSNLTSRGDTRPEDM